MGCGLLLVTMAVCLSVGVSGWRHDGGTSHGNHHGGASSHGNHHGGASSHGNHHGGASSHGKHARGANHKRVTPEHQNNTVVVAQVGSAATIKCYTHFYGDEMVTWMKRDEDQLLTAGGQVYSSEARYSVAHFRHQKLWELWVRDVRASDAGLYECQLTTHPPTSFFFTLKVVEARAVLGGGPDVHVHTGGRLRLHCTVELATETPAYIFWFHNHTMINYSPRRPLRVLNQHHGSSLVISNVTWEDAGTYTCEPHLARPANLTLHVVEGEKHAALQNGHNDGAEQDDTAAGDSAHFSSTSLLIGYSCLLTLLRYSYFENSNSDILSWL